MSQFEWAALWALLPYGLAAVAISVVLLRALWSPEPPPPTKPRRRIDRREFHRTDRRRSQPFDILADRRQNERRSAG